MNKTEPIQATDEAAIKWQDLYSPVMIVVLVVFVVCEGLFFFWSDGPEFTDGMFYGFEGLLLAGVFFVTRCSRVCGASCWLSLLRALLLVAAGFMFLCVFGLLAPEGARRMARRSACVNNLKQIGLALQNYQEAFGQFPPAFVPSEAGQPMHSWRALLLPYMEMNSLYQKLDLEQAWDSPENQKVGEYSIDALLCPGPDMPYEPRNRTDYVAVVGDDTLLPSDGSSRSVDDITADLSKVAVLTEVNNSDIPWHEPRDLTLDDLASGKTSWSETGVHMIPSIFGERSIFYGPKGRARNILFADGHVGWGRNDLTPEELRRLFSITKQPGEEDESLYADTPQRPLIFRHIIFYVWLLALFVQFVQATGPTTSPVTK